MYSNNSTYGSVTKDLSRLNLGVSNTGSPDRSPNNSRKVAPLVPPKPKKQGPPLEGEQAIYTNLPSTTTTTHTGIPDFYAVNAPAPGIIGVASARKNQAYTGNESGNVGPGMGGMNTGDSLSGVGYAPSSGQGSRSGISQNLNTGVTGGPDVGGMESLPAGEEFSGVIIPGFVYTSSSGQVPKGGVSPNPNFIPPPPQPSHSYKPVGRRAVAMSAQPLYSNTEPGHGPSKGPHAIYDNQRPQEVGHGHPNAPQAIYDNQGPQEHGPSAIYSNTRQLQEPAHATYGNLSTNGTALYANVTSGQSSYSSYGLDKDFPLPPPLPPPSPVSSSYSELHRASPQQHQQQQHQQQHQQQTYAPASHTSSTYESIYEPITPRPSSQMSGKSGGSSGGYNLYSPYTSGSGSAVLPNPATAAAATQNVPMPTTEKSGKEAEVDALTSLLVQSMDNTSDPEFFGICRRCGDRVTGEGTGCTAMEDVYHIRCFVCVVCHLQLQGKPFYALDSKPYCEDCYLNTLEKCSVCTKPILDRILRATGKPYHPRCFTCVVCNKSLDGIPFTVDASNQIHCIEDFHRKFAPRCSVCLEPIMPEAGKEETVRVVALDRSFHVSCYRCEDCGLVLSSEAEGKGCYPLDGHVLCKSCNARRVQAITSTDL